MSEIRLDRVLRLMASLTVMGGKKTWQLREADMVMKERYALSIVLVLIASLLVGGVSYWPLVGIN